MTFKRKYELDRHVRDMHPAENTRVMSCPAINCNKFKFVRKDKLKSHINKSHSGAKFECPVPACLQGNLAFLREN